MSFTFSWPFFQPTLLLLKPCFISIILPSHTLTSCSVSLYTRCVQPSRVQDFKIMVWDKVWLKTTIVLAAPNSCRPLQQQLRRFKAMIYIGKYTRDSSLPVNHVHGRYYASTFLAMIYIGKYTGDSFITRVYQSAICTGDITQVSF